MGVLSDSLGIKKDKKFGERQNRGSFGKKKSFIKKRSDKNIISKEDRDYLNWLQNQDYPCFVCGKINPSDPIEWHHVKLRSSDKKDHTKLIPLCGSQHHRLGKQLSPHGSPKVWRETFTIEFQYAFASNIYSDYKKALNV